MNRLTRDGTAEPVSRDQILRRERGQGNIHFPCSADQEQDWQPYPVDPYPCYMCDHTYIHTYIHTVVSQYTLQRMVGTLFLQELPILDLRQNKYLQQYSFEALDSSVLM